MVVNDPVKAEEPIKTYVTQKDGLEKTAVTKKHIDTIKTGLSINGLLNKNQSRSTGTATNNEDNKTDIEISEGIEKQTNEFTQEQLNNAWGKFAEVMKSKKKANLYSMMQNNKPVITSTAEIKFTVPNKVLEEQLNEEKIDMMRFLRQELKNTTVQLKIVVAENIEGVKLYTTSDKYKRLVEKNPAIQKLKQSFDLDIDY